MIGNILSDIFNGFSLHDLPFLFIQMGAAALVAWLIRMYWLKTVLSHEESWLVRYILPLQVAFTLLAVFSQRSPWMAVVFGLAILVIAAAGNQLSLRSRVFFTLTVIAAWGIGGGHLLVTCLIYFLLVWPFIHFASAEK